MCARPSIPERAEALSRSRRASKRPDGAVRPRPRGRPRDSGLDALILAAGEHQLEEKGYAGMSMESVAAAAGTTVPTLRRRYPNKMDLVAAVVDSLRIEPLPSRARGPRADALAILANFQRNLERPLAMATLGSILSEEHRNPLLLERFRTRLLQPRRAMLCQALADGVSAGQLPRTLDVDAATNMLIGSFYARYLSGEPIPKDWARRVLVCLWPTQRRQGSA
jgi:AcrR family transcriptional regulator